jgi:ABC-type nitrate/sulfonate/bicarbonate transport system ATPase subunit
MKPIIALKNITKSYRNFAILHDVSLEIPEGSFTVLIGPSGCGKSTLLKMIAGIEHPSSGSVIAPEAMTMVFQNGSLLPWKTAHENIGIALESSALSTTQKNTAISHALTMMGLDALAGSYPRTLLDAAYARKEAA